MTTAGLHTWPVISHPSLRSMTDRVAFTKAFSRPWSDIKGPEVAHVVQFLISRFVNQPSVHFQDYQSAWSFEHELIAQWQTPLNFPRATQFLKKTALGYSVSQEHRMSAHSTYGLRLWRKLGKRLRGCRKDCRKTAWNILFDLGSFTKASRNAARLIRSRSMSNDELCALMKLRRRNVAHPARGENQSLVKSAVKFRTTMHWPKSARPLGVLPLAHPSFNSDWEGWLKSIVSDFK